MRAKVSILVLLVAGACAFGQSSPQMSISLTPGADMPRGDNMSYFRFGGGAELSLGIEDLLPVVSPRLSLGYDYAPLPKDGVHLIHAGLGAAFPLKLAPSVLLSPYILGGYTYGLISDGSGQGGGAFAKGGVALAWLLNPLFSLGVDASYRWDIGAWGGVSVSLYSAVRFPLVKAASGPKPIKGVELLSVDLSPVFPALFKRYDATPFGTVTLHNLEKSALTDVIVDFSVEGYMDNPSRLLALAKLDPGAQQEVEVKALFSEQVLKITEATKVSARLSVSFVFEGQPYTMPFNETLRLYNRNNITWDDTKKAAAFVTPNDPLVLTLGKNAVAVTADVQSGQIDTRFIAAMAVHEALRAKGQRYSVDPNTPFSDVSKNGGALDTVQYPPETLTYGAGDCDDLTVLYCALLESLGANTAFITIPGHIYAAVRLDVTPDLIGGIFSERNDLIVRDGQTWLPVEVTMCGDRFLDAWQTGAKEWREFEANGQAGFFPVKESWQTYEPIGQIPALATAVKMPDRAAVAAGYRAELKRFVDGEIRVRAPVLQKEISAQKNDAKPINSLGVLYAEFGQIDLASAQFEAARKIGNYLPAIVNLANVRFLFRDFKGALALYSQANSQDPKNFFALLGMARSNAALEKFDDARAQYAALQKLDPELASRYAYLGEQGTTGPRQASADAAAGKMSWDEGGQ